MHIKRKALKAAFPPTIPILTAFLFLGFSYGIYMRTNGFSVWYPILMSLSIFAGSMEFVTGALLLSAFHPVSAFLLTLMVNARHLFYGISMLEKYHGTGAKKCYLIFGMCDESFSINYSTPVPPGIDRGWFYFFVTLFNHSYWVTGATLGAQLGGVLPINPKGIDFVMTALFVVIFLNQWKETKNHLPALLGIAGPLACLLIFGADNFMIPSMLLLVACFAAARRKLDQREEEEAV